MYILADIWSEPLFVGLITPSFAAAVVFIAKKVSNIFQRVDSMHEAQQDFRDSIQEIMLNQSDISGKVNVLGNDLRSHMAGEDRIVDEILDSLKRVEIQLDSKSLHMARTAFRQAAVHSEAPFYDTSLINGQWVFQWGNRAYFELAGITLAEAKSDIFWDVNVDKDHQEHFQKTISGQADRGEIIDVDFTFVSPERGKFCVNLSAVPVFDKDENPMAYFGAIKILKEGSCHE